MKLARTFGLCALLGCTMEQDLGPAHEECVVWLPRSSYVTASGVPARRDPADPQCSVRYLPDDGDFGSGPPNTFVPGPAESDPYDLGCAADSDGDGHFGPHFMCPYVPAHSFGLDCDDADPAAHESSVETCDGIDQDCDSAIDEGRACAIDVALGADARALDPGFAPGYLDLAVDDAGAAFGIGHDARSAEEHVVVTGFDASGESVFSHRLPFLEHAPVLTAALATHGERLYAITHSHAFRAPDGQPTESLTTTLFAFDTADGELLWRRTLWSLKGGFGALPPIAIAALEDGLRIAAVYDREQEVRATGLRVAHLDFEGEMVWLRETQVAGESPYASSALVGLAALPTGELYVAGTTEDALSWEGCEPTQAWGFVVALDAEGHCGWVLDVPYEIDLTAFAATADGSVVVGGAASSGARFADTPIEVARFEHELAESRALFVARLHDDAALAWLQVYPQSPFPASLQDIAVAPDGSSYAAFAWTQAITGVTHHPPYGDFELHSLGVVSALDVEGAEVWSRDVAFPVPAASSALRRIAIAPDGKLAAIAEGVLVTLSP